MTKAQFDYILPTFHWTHYGAYSPWGSWLEYIPQCPLLVVKGDSALGRYFGRDRKNRGLNTEVWHDKEPSQHQALGAEHWPKFCRPPRAMTGKLS